MIVESLLDLSEAARKDLPEQARVLIFAGDGGPDDAFGLDAALAAIGRCRLIREGHVFETEIHHSRSASIFVSHYRWRLDEETGEVVSVP